MAKKQTEESEEKIAFGVNFRYSGNAAKLILEEQSKSILKNHGKQLKGLIIQRLLCEEYKRRHNNCGEC